MAETETQQNVAYVTPLVGELLLPVSESSPTGRDVSYEDDFQALKAEVDLISSPTGEADFERIVSLAQLVLREQSKDLVTAGYLTVGLMQTRGVAGLAEGWSVVQGLLERYWEGLYPGKAVRRRNALQFLSDRSREYLERLRERKPSVEERGALEGALLAVRSVQGFAMEALGDQAPALSGLVSLLNERLRRVPEPEPAAGEGPGPGETEGAPASDPEAGAAPPAAPEPATAASGDDAGADGFSSPLVGELLLPVSESSPTGRDVSYEDDFQALKAEVDLISSPTGEADFERIVSLAQLVLREQSKDLVTAGYLTVGLMQTRGVAGLAEGWSVVQGLLERYWEGLYPGKAVRRRNALQFLSDRSREYLERLRERKPSVEERGALEGALLAVRSVQGFAMEALGDQAPALSGLVSLLNERLRRVPEPEPEPEAPPASRPAPPAGTPAAPAAAPPAAAGAPAEIKAATDAESAVLKAIGFLRNDNPKNPLPYRLLRVLYWSKIPSDPPHENGLTRVQPPNLSRLAVYEQGFQKGLYEDLVRIAESEFPEGSFSFWLTIQRFVGQALEALGAPYAPVAEAVKLELALLLRRVPVLTTLAFADGTPFADPLTVEWVETQVRPLLGSGDGGGAATAAEDHLERLFQEARKKLGTGDLKAALAVMQQEADRDTSDAHRFRRRLYVALLCLRGGQPGVARSTLESLDQQIAHHALDAWDPALALEVWSNLYTCYATLARTPDGEQAGFQEKARQTLDKISRLDVGYALSLLGKK